MNPYDSSRAWTYCLVHVETLGKLDIADRLTWPWAEIDSHLVRMRDDHPASLC